MKFQWNWRLARCHHPWTGRRKVMPWPGEERVWYWLLRRFFFLEVNHPFFPPFFKGCPILKDDHKRCKLVSVLGRAAPQSCKVFPFFERSKKCKLSRWNPPTVTILYAPRDPKMRFDPSVDAIYGKKGMSSPRPKSWSSKGKLSSSTSLNSRQGCSAQHGFSV